MVISIQFFCHYPSLYLHFRLLLNGCPLIAIHKARYFKREDGLALGPGPFATALEYAASTTATIVGKPERSFFQEALADMGIKPENALMIGDVRLCSVVYGFVICPISLLKLISGMLTAKKNGVKKCQNCLFQDAKDDIGGAQNIGIRGILVSTGMFNQSNNLFNVPWLKQILCKRTLRLILSNQLLCRNLCLCICVWRVVCVCRGPFVRKMDSANHRIVIFSTVLKMLQN